ncbi:conserved hypothetical protein [Streptomyces sviceus ATCC 29083]|uniref:Uncharacterized protein n=2 Tax=Streptomyces TaxID=1883 RepID=B5I3R3_STRX2|nr:conserved hypothetical protein [Streptomyces sviceus ATCC 29083]
MLCQRVVGRRLECCREGVHVVRHGGCGRVIPPDIERAVRNSWGADTCPPEDLPQWSTGNPARGQCGVTAMVLNDLLGGELIRGEVRVNGEFRDYHWWNRIGIGVEIDLTRGQFRPEEIVTGGTVVPRPPVTEWRRLREEYELLRSRVMEELDRHRSGSGEPSGGLS